MNLSKAIEEFIICSIWDKTYRPEYRYAFDRMLAYFGAVDVEDIQYADLKHFVSHEIDSEMDHAVDLVATIKQRYRIIRELIIWLYVCGEIAFPPIKIPPEYEKPPMGDRPIYPNSFSLN